MVRIRQLLWDDWNVAHIARHEATPEDVEAVCHGPHIAYTTYARRLLLIGPAREGQLLTVVLAPKQADTYYPVTARPASRKERRWYEAVRKEAA